MKETALVKMCLEYLHLKGVFAWRNNSGMLKKGEHFIRFGAVGSADILGIINHGRFLAIECKVGKNKMSAQQTLWKARIEDMGGLHILAYSLDDLEKHSHLF